MTTLRPPNGAIYRKDPGQPRWGLEGSAQTFVQGDFLRIDSSEQLVIAAAADNDVGAVLLAGRALAPATGTPNTRIPFDKGNNCEHKLPVYHATAASAVTSQDHVGKFTTLTNVGGVWALKVAAFSATYTTSLQMLVVEVAQDHAVGEQYGYEWAMIAIDSRQYN